MKVIVKKPVTLTHKAGEVLGIDASLLRLIADYVEVKKETPKKKKGE